jgi:hypothetical protein
MKSVPDPAPEPVAIDGDTPTLRLFALLEVIASQRPVLLAAKPGRGNRPAQAHAAPHAAAAGKRRHAAARSDGRQYGTGVRLRRLAENLLLNTPCMARAMPCCARWSTRSAKAATSPRCPAARCSTSTAWRPRAAALLPAFGLARAGALLGQRQALPGADDARTAPAPAGTCATGALHAQAR